MLLHDKTDDQSGVGVGKEKLAEGKEKLAEGNEETSERTNERAKGERTVKDDVHDRRIATTDSV